MRSVPVSANSYMFDHGTRPDAMPRVIVAAEVEDEREHRQRGADARPHDAAAGRAAARRGPHRRRARACIRARSRSPSRPPRTAPRAPRSRELGDPWRRRPRAAAREIDGVGDEGEGVDGDRGPDQQHRDRVEREGSGMAPVYVGSVPRPGAAAPRRRAARARARRRAAGRPGRPPPRASGPRRGRDRRTRCASVRPSAVTLTHMRRRGTNSAASSPASASTAKRAPTARRRRGGSTARRTA